MTPQNLLHDFLPEAVMHALGWTLLHSLWQGALVALLLAALLGLMHRHSAAIRYKVAGAGLLAMLLLAAVTFYQVYEPAATGGTEITTVATQHNVTTAQGLAEEPAPSLWQKVTSQGQAYFNQHLPAVVTLWLLGMLLMTLRLLGGWVYVQRLKSYRTQLVAEAWQQKAVQLGQRLGLKQAVKVAESALVQVPMVVGHFKPLVLLPLGALSGLSTAQVEAILAHELAHVYRRDYLMNLLQSVVETLFFFHPGVWWISDCIRTEREHACDDLALALCGDSLTYAYALTSLEEMNMKKNETSPRLAMAFSGRRRTLLGRISRLVHKSTLRPSFSEGFLASCTVMAAVLVLSVSAWANSSEETMAEKNVATEKEPSARTSTAAEELKAVLDHTEDGYSLQQLEDGIIIVQNKKGKVIEVYVNGQRVPKSELGKYQERIQRQLAAAKEATVLRNEEDVERAMEKAEAALERLEEEDEFYAPAPPAPPAPSSPRAPLAPRAPGALGVAPVPPVPPVPPVAPLPDDEEGLARYKRAMKDYEARMKAYEARVREFEARQQEFNARLEANHAGRMEDHSRRMEEHKVRVAEHGERMKDHEKRMAEHKVRLKEHEERMKKHEAMMKALKAELLADGFIKSADDDYLFKMDKTGLYINDKKQPDALFEKYKKLMQKATGDDVELILKKDGANFIINNKSSTTTK
ncbi:M56 family metallopeptidase [Rufibacter roseus]|uniref:M56 family metallopeptidase n=1 Tax=Rufibacter roseus TaxID=1567108 RepID=A0ABW2DEX7_9BACT|nr:M56 family metallopeptidase [Rufibacter roseus]